MSGDVDEAYYAELSAWAESDAATEAIELAIANGKGGRTDAAGRAAIRALLMAATEDDPEGRAMLEEVLARPATEIEP